jgi:hypothetical protein
MFVYAVTVLADKDHPMKELGNITLSAELKEGKSFNIKEHSSSLYMRVEVVTITKQGETYLAHVRRTKIQPTSDMWDNKMKSLKRIATGGLRCPVTFI